MISAKSSHLMQRIRFQTPPILVAIALSALIGPAVSRAGDATNAAAPAPQLTPEQTAAAKLAYSLFNPTPESLLRPFNADRPSKTDSPITVDAGIFQLEADFANFTYDRYNALGTDTKVKTLLVAPTFLRVGLFANTDLQILIPGYNRIDTEAAEPAAPSAGPSGPLKRQSSTVDGYGDMLFRLKINLIGNDSGNFALAVIPFIKAPTASHGVGNGRVEGGINFPISYNLPAGFMLFAQGRFDALFNGDNDGYHVLFSESIGVGRAIPGILQGKLSSYAELASAVSSRLSKQDPYALTADTGLIYQLTTNIAIDVDSFFGLTRGAPDVNIFGGIAIRI
jgi:hypothetical protein